MGFYLRVHRLSLPTFVRISGPPQKSIPTSIKKSQTSCPRLPRSSPSAICVGDHSKESAGLESNHRHRRHHHLHTLQALCSGVVGGR